METDKNKIIKREFLARDTEIVARELLGKVLCRRNGDLIQRGMIIETEAYTQDDPACHAYRGETPRAKTLFKKPGTSYIYFIYGMYNCLNIVTDREGFGSGVLLRALEPMENIERTSGPGLLCKAMNITCELNECDVTTGDYPIWLEYGREIPDDNVIKTPRIGIKVALDYKRRFLIVNK